MLSRKTFSRWSALVSFIVTLLVLSPFTQEAFGQVTHHEVHSFGTDPAYPYGQVIDGGDGFLYGTTNSGGPNGGGTVYKIKPDGTSFTVVHGFDGDCSNGCYPLAGVILGSDGFLYGTTGSGGPGGYGTVYRVKPDGTLFSMIHGFNCSDGCHAYSPVILASDGFLYGTTYTGGPNGYGTVYKVKPDGTSFSTVYGFNYWDGAYPYLAGVVLGGDGFLYGTTLTGGPGGYGTVYKVKPDGTSFGTIQAFACCSDGYHPYAGVIIGGDGFLYGTTSWGGSSGGGTVYKVMPDGSAFSSVHGFNCSDGCAVYSGVIDGGDGFLYGTTHQGGSYGYGTVYKVMPDGTSFSTLHGFNYSSDGGHPYNSGVTLGDGGYLYGVTCCGGPNGAGTLFKVKPDGTSFSAIKAFNYCADGCYPQAGVILSGAYLYGTTYQGGPNGTGTVYKVKPDGTSFSTIHTFVCCTDGYYPYAGVIDGGDGFLYGTTLYGGSSGGAGTVYKVKPDGTSFSTVHTFVCCTDGYYPYAGVVMGGDGFLYGTTLHDWQNGTGTVYRVKPDGTSFSTVHTFVCCTDGYYPYAGVVMGGDGYLYGTTAHDWQTSGGTVYKVMPDGTSFSTIHNFNYSDGYYPYAGVIDGSDGFLYGTTYQGGTSGVGTVYKVKRDGTSFSTLHAFDCSDGCYPYFAGVTLGGDSYLYGTTSSSGPNGAGTVYKLLPDGTSFSTVHSFNCSDGCNPHSGVTIGPDGSVYGTTPGGGTAWAGTVYRLIGDNQGPTINIVTPANGANYLLNQAVASNYSCSDAVGVSSCTGPVSNGNNFDTATIGAKSFAVNAQDTIGNTSSATNNYTVSYASGGSCNGAPGHAILQPINADGTSVVKRGSTVPAKFRVCDGNGVSIGSAGVVSSFKLVQVLTGTVSSSVNEDPVSTTPDAAFRWDATDKQWIYNINTKNLTAGKTYIYNITLNDSSVIAFQFGLK